MVKKKSRGKGRSASSSRWIARQTKDPFVRQAKAGGHRSRAIFKLEQLDANGQLLKKGQRVLDLGSAPGGWSQYAVQRVGETGAVVAVDLLPMAPIPGVVFIQGDFLSEETVVRLLEITAGQGYDWILSDMAPNISGIRDRDEAQHEALVDATLALAAKVLKPKGGMLVKLFEGAARDACVSRFKKVFAQTEIKKPAASRSDSREIYLLAKRYNPGE